MDNSEGGGAESAANSEGGGAESAVRGGGAVEDADATQGQSSFLEYTLPRLYVRSVKFAILDVDYLGIVTGKCGGCTLEIAVYLFVCDYACFAI